MKRTLLFALLFTSAMNLMADERTIDISGNNTSSDYKSYDQYISLPAGSIVNVKMARYCYFSSRITGGGTLNLYAGGERCYLGTAKGAAWPDWAGFWGDVHVFPFRENSSSAGFYGIVLAHGGKRFSPESLDGATVNNSMESNHVTLHNGATICCEANSAGSGFRIGELQAEEGSTILGYMKTKRPAYYLLGSLNTDATLAGTIMPSSYDESTLIGIIKEGTGTYRITGNQNYLSGALRVIKGRVLISNDRTEAETRKLRGGLGARPNENEAVAYVFEQGVLGGTGSIGGMVDNYGTIEPGEDIPGTLTLKNYVSASKNANLQLHPGSILRFKLSSAESHDQLVIAGNLKFSSMKQDFSTSDEMPEIQLSIADDASLQEGDEFTLLTAKSKTNDWQFTLRQPGKYTWKLEERTTDGIYSLVLCLVSLNDNGENQENPDDPDHPVSTIGAFYDDGIDDMTDSKSLRYYANENKKFIGTALYTWKNDVSNENLAETREAGAQFNMVVAENEMKMDALQPNRGEFTFWGADNLVNFAQRHQMAVRGHCLVWHKQQPQWVSSDGQKNDKNWSRAEALQILKTHIETVMQHFKGKVTEWDVVNECLEEDQSIVRTNPQAYILRQTVWQRAIGDDYIDSAFVYAHRADPSAVLYLNDYDVELQGQAKTVAYYNLATRLKNAGIPIDGVGLQCHFSVGEVDSVKLARNIRHFGEAGLKCIITELDMGTPSTSAKDLEEQARNYRVITDVVLNNENCPNMVIWGLKDNDSWRSASNPLLYTAGLAKKPAYYAVRSALRHRVITGASAVAPISTVRQLMPEAVYTMDGRRVNAASLAPGIYIRNGRKFIVGTQSH